MNVTFNLSTNLKRVTYSYTHTATYESNSRHYSTYELKEILKVLSIFDSKKFFNFFCVQFCFVSFFYVFSFEVKDPNNKNQNCLSMFYLLFSKPHPNSTSNHSSLILIMSLNLMVGLVSYWVGSDSPVLHFRFGWGLY